MLAALHVFVAFSSGILTGVGEEVCDGNSFLQQVQVASGVAVGLNAERLAVRARSSLPGPIATRETAGELSPSCSLLVYWAVGAEHRSLMLVRKNINYLRRSLDGHCQVDVFLNHYTQEGLRGWEREGAWYTRNVQFSAEQRGYKFQAMQKNWRASWSKYSWVWALDEDADFTMMDLPAFLAYASESKALLAIPAFSQAGNTREERELVYKIQAPKKPCLYRHVPLIEVIFPLFRPAVLDLILVKCPDCIGKNTTWGLDKIWCGYAAHELLEGEAKKDGTRACIVVDATPMVHANFRTLKKKYDHRAEKSVFQDMGFADMDRFHKKYPQFFVTGHPLKAADCIRVSNYVDRNS